jgi:glycine/D-amino acid oxidase-like deaminating enzyme
MNSPADFIIIGAGIAGLSAAAELATSAWSLS